MSEAPVRAAAAELLRVCDAAQVYGGPRVAAAIEALRAALAAEPAGACDCGHSWSVHTNLGCDGSKCICTATAPRASTRPKCQACGCYPHEGEVCGVRLSGTEWCKCDRRAPGSVGRE